MSKYIIEIEDVPFSKVHFDADNGAQNINLYRVKGFNAFVFDKDSLDKLTPLDKELEKAYQKGLSQGYSDGYEECRYDRDTIKYQQGLNDAWETAKKIAAYSGTNKPLDEMFGMHGVFDIINKFSASEALAKIHEYEQQLQKQEIEVGDEVKAVSGNAIVVRKYMGNDGVERCEYWYYENARIDHDATTFLRKTGRHFPQMVELIKAMKGE